MSILTKEEILKEIEAGTIEIVPFDKKQVGPASIDLHLGDRIWTFKGINTTIPVDDRASGAGEALERKNITGEWLLLPHETVIAITKEEIKLPPTLCGWLEGRGRFVHLGLSLHTTPGFIQPGVNGHIFFAITNLGHAALKIHPGTSVCQLILQRTVGKARYKGMFQHFGTRGA